MAQEDTKRFNYVAMAVTGIATLAYMTMYLCSKVSQAAAQKQRNGSTSGVIDRKWNRSISCFACKNDAINKSLKIITSLVTPQVIYFI